VNRSSRAKPRSTLARIRRDRERIAVVDDQCFDFGPKSAEVSRSKSSPIVHILIVRGCGAARSCGSSSASWRTSGPTRSRQQQSAGTMPPRSDQAGQGGDQAHGAAAAAHALHAVVQANRRRLRAGVLARERAHTSASMPQTARSALRRPRERPLAQLRPAVVYSDRCSRVEPIVLDELLHQAERERAVGAGQYRDVFVALVGGFGAPRIDADQLRAEPFRLLRNRPEMQVRGNAVAAPDQDQPALLEVLDVHTDALAIGRLQRGSSGARANRAIEQRGAEAVEEARGHGFALNQAQVPE
jgi:hypothetical protein